MGSEERYDIVIVGGGIVGLATALALHRKGVQSLVLEKSDSLRSAGSGIGVFINGWRALDQLGVSTQLQMKSIPISEVHDGLINRSRIRVTPCRNEALRCLKRSDLVEAIANGLPAKAKSVRFGCQVVAVGRDPLTSFPVVHLDDGTNIKAKVLIGCDGSNSVVAKSLGLEAPRLFQMNAVRGLTNYPNGHIYGNTGFRLIGDQLIFGRIPIDDKLVFWFVAWRDHSTDSEVEKIPENIRDLSLELLKEFPTKVIEMVKDCDLDSLSFTHIRHRAPWNFLLQNLYRGTMTVAGDAMHVMGPFLAQGGSSGLEDAIVLGRCLSRELQLGSKNEIDDDEFKKRSEVALKSYVKERRLRVLRLSIQSYIVGSIVATSSWGKRFLCIVILVTFFGGMSLSHTRYNCGPL
ncbi:uncharacterized protein LOC109824247 [Asparagus officinalis]|uniref:uncharacterized protein LOC109824247 n=1 Tax=Asparagus officinalis TaxID=4686 RepID=UPI00098E7C61|nr:uncharacterized protein LOC109824247 [Asparagus officinalis]